MHDNTWQVRLIFERELSAASPEKAKTLPTSDKAQIKADCRINDPKCSAVSP
jgi:hypothetical protein